MTRLLAPMLLLVLPELGLAAEVVWLDPPTDEDALRVAVRARARLGPLTPAAFRARAVAVDPDGDRTLDMLEDTLEQVRIHEKVLDGELLILQGLEAPLQQVRLLRSEQDRELVARALLYQGFAADRYWGDTLGEAEDAAAWRIRIDDRVVERPWLDAFALDPLRPAAPQDISEAPQRDAYEALRKVLARSTRATVVAADLPPRAEIVLDGVVQEFGEDLTLEVLPGRHWLHVQLDGEILGVQDERLEPAQRLEVSLPVPESEWQDMVRVLHGAESVVPDSVGEIIDELGGEVWFAEGTGNTLRVWAATPKQVRKIPMSTVLDPEADPDGEVSVAAWAGAGLLHSPDFDAQETDVDAAPLAFAPVVGGEIAWDRGWLRYGLGMDVSLPVGGAQVALTGDEGRMRLRPAPHLIIGHPLVQASVGWLFPYHLAGGLRASVPLGEDGLEARGLLRVAFPPARQRADGTSWQGAPIVQLAIGVGARARP